MRILRYLPALLLFIALKAVIAQNVGFQSTGIKAPQGSFIPVNIWYPTTAQPVLQPLGLFRQLVGVDGPVRGANLTLVVISHGSGGTRDGHYDTALALAKAGFIVAALEHTGDNYRDQSLATDVLNRPRELHALIDYMLSTWPQHTSLNSQRVGAFGFSAGGFTVLAAAGGNPNLSLVSPHCAAHPTFYDCTLLAAHPPVPSAAAQTVTHDPRIKALVVAAPALGFTFADGLGSVTQPVQLWRADDDRILPPPEYADAVKIALPTAPEFHAVPEAGHFDFLAPCTSQLAEAAPQVCTSEPGFDRQAFHKTFNQSVVAFFTAHLN